MRATPATTGRQSMPPPALTSVRSAESAPCVDLGARVEWTDAGWSPPPDVGPDAEARSPQDRVRLAHRATSTRPWTCRSCCENWPCEARLHLDEVSAEARQRYAAQVHADWLAGRPTRWTTTRRLNALHVQMPPPQEDICGWCLKSWPCPSRRWVVRLLRRAWPQSPPWSPIRARTERNRMTNTEKAPTPPTDEMDPPADVVQLGDVAARTQGGGGGGSEDKRFIYS